MCNIYKYIRCIRCCIRAYIGRLWADAADPKPEAGCQQSRSTQTAGPWLIAAFLRDFRTDMYVCIYI